jgi:hypothetical protein
VSCSPLKVNWHFEGTCHLYFQGQRKAKQETNWLTFNELHDVISQKTEHCIITAVRTSNPKLLIKYMEHSPYWETNICSGSQQILRILWSSQVHYHIHKSPEAVPIQKQMNPIHTLPYQITFKKKQHKIVPLHPQPEDPPCRGDKRPT